MDNKTAKPRELTCSELQAIAAVSTYQKYPVSFSL